MNLITRLKCAVRDIMRRRDAKPSPNRSPGAADARKRRKLVYWPVAADHR